jgi:hypothetical protein
VTVNVEDAAPAAPTVPPALPPPSPPEASWVSVRLPPVVDPFAALLTVAHIVFLARH